MSETKQAGRGAVAGPVEPTVRPRSEWEHLLPYGYAPGHYMGTCRTCGTVCIDLDKRAASCRPCAEAKYAAREFTPAELVLMNEAGRANWQQSRCPEPAGWLHEETGDFEHSRKPWMDDGTK